MQGSPTLSGITPPRQSLQLKGRLHIFRPPASAWHYSTKCRPASGLERGPVKPTTTKLLSSMHLKVACNSCAAEGRMADWKHLLRSDGAIAVFSYDDDGIASPAQSSKHHACYPRQSPSSGCQLWQAQGWAPSKLKGWIWKGSSRIYPLVHPLIYRASCKEEKRCVFI